MNLTKLLTVNNLSKTYYTKDKEILAINDINFNLYKEDFLGIVGPSGCGKSTILNIISGLEKDYKGIFNYKENISVAYMLQDDALFPWLTVLDNALLGLKITKILTKENLEYTNELLKKYKLYDFRNNYPSSLSGGMKQRLALIRTLALKPDILLLDEPYSALDYQTRLQVCNDVYNIIKNENKTALIVTHNIDEAVSLCNRIIILSKRPSHIKKTINIDLINNEAKYYHDLIWKELDI